MILVTGRILTEFRVDFPTSTSGSMRSWPRTGR